MKSNRIMKKEEDFFKIILSILILLLTGLLFYIIQYYQLLFGDDILFQYENSHYYYTELKEWEPNNMITNLSMMLAEVWARWKCFSGRFSTVILVPLLNILGQQACAVIGSIVYVLFIICIGRVIWGSWTDIFRHPFGLLCIYLLQFQFSPTASYMQMWTFVCHYSMPTVLCLVYYICWVEYTKKQKSVKLLIVLNLFGIVVGATHELLPLYCFILIGIRGIVLYKKKFFRPLVVSNIGIFLGWLFVVAAPGNLVRMGIEHDKRRMETGIVEKCATSLNAHIKALGVENFVVKVIFVLGVVIVVNTVVHKKENIRQIMIDNIEFLATAMMSVVLWAIVAPPVAQYSLAFFKAIVVIFFLKLMQIDPKFKKQYVVFTGIMVGIAVLINVGWSLDLIEVTTYRRQQIENAKKENMSEVVLINYPESTANYYTLYNRGNTPGIYDVKQNTLFYGIRLITVE